MKASPTKVYDCVEPIALSVILVALAFVASCSFMIAVRMTKNATFRIPQNWIENVEVLANSPELQYLLNSLGGISDSFMDGSLRLCWFRLARGMAIRVKASIPVEVPVDSRSSRHEWTPRCRRWYMLALALTIPLVSIFVLEDLWQRSERQEGFAAFNNFTAIQVLAIRYVSILIALLIANIANGLHFVTMTLSPLHSLCSSRITPAQIPRLSLVGHMLPIAFTNAVLTGQYGASLSMIAMTIGSMLTIIALGLWSVTDGIGVQEMQFVRQDVWELTSAQFNGGQNIKTSEDRLVSTLR